ncbi:homoserine O-acetyltransferase [candidate division KSB1 bacterium]|nr:homoserine O-acetyltransferase [candidate division KSB1 bacterium]
MHEKIIVSTKNVKLFSKAQPFQFECGALLPEIQVAYETYGVLNAAGDNAVLICHALTGNAHAAFYHTQADRSPGWWHGFIGLDCALDPRKNFIICANLLSSCYGTSGPISINPASGQIYGMNFPPTTTRDMVRVQKALLDYLGVNRLCCVTGGSLGGMQVWEWLVQYPEFIEKAIPIAGTAFGSPWMIALNDAARQAIFNDPNWNEGHYQTTPPAAGLHLARMMGMISYRTPAQFWQKFKRDRVESSPTRTFDRQNMFQIESYLHYQGQKLVQRFDARSYIYLTKAMDWHDVSLGFPSPEAALQRIQAQVLVLGINSDLLYLPAELTQLTHTLQHLGKSVRYEEIDSIYGHDAFLIEYQQMNPIVARFLSEKPRFHPAKGLA